MAAWPSGLGRGLQSPVRRLDSARRLEIKDSQACRSWTHDRRGTSTGSATGEGLVKKIFAPLAIFPLVLTGAVGIAIRPLLPL